MKPTITTLLILATAITLSAQQSPVAAKPAEAPKVPATIAKPPALVTSKLWRLVSKAQALRTQLDSSEAGKAVKDAEMELQAEQATLSAKCAEVGMVLGYDSDVKSATYQDIVCSVATPKDQTKAPTNAPK